MNIYQTLSKLNDKQKETERIQAKYIYEDEKTGQIKSRPLKLDSAGASVHIKPAKLIHDSIFQF